MLWAALVVVFACPEKADNVVLSFGSQLGGGTVVYKVHESQLASIPEWPAESNSPVLSPREAIKLGTTGLRMLEKRGFVERLPRSNEWELIEASLVPITERKWLWKLRFEEIPGEGEGLSGITDEATVVVLMNGINLVPTRTTNDLPRDKSN